VARSGGLEAMFLPNEGAGFWPLISMGRDSRRHDGVRRLTSIVFRVLS